MVEAEKIIIRPIISEKSYAQIDHSRYTFEVHPDAHKTMIAQAIAQLFNVTVISVCTANVRPSPSAAASRAGAPRPGRRLSCSLPPATRSNSSRAGNGHQEIQADLARPSLHDDRHVRGHHSQSEPERSLLAPLKKNGGRNSYGRITTRHQGGGHKRRYRIIDFKRDKDGVPAKVAQIEYDPNRSARIALLHYADGEKRYILAPQGSGSATGSSPARPPTSSPATRCRSRTSRPVPPSTTSSFSRVAAVSWCAAPAPAPSFRPRRGATAIVRLPSGELRRIRVSPVAPPSARSATPTTPTSTAARLAARAGAACVPRFAAPR